MAGHTALFDTCQNGDLMNDTTEPNVLGSSVVHSEPTEDIHEGLSEFAIAEVDKTQGSVLGGDTVWLRCISRVRKDRIRVHFRDPETGWEAYGRFSPNAVYGQILIVFETPPFGSSQTSEPKQVDMCLVDGDRTSPTVQFIYSPIDESKSTLPFSTEEPISVQKLERILTGTANDGASRLHTIMSELWKNQLKALWTFAAEGDPKSLVASSKHLISWRNPNDGCTVLHMSARNKQSFALRTLLTTLESNSDRQSVLNCRNFRGQTALHSAVRASDADSVHYLISAGAERTIVDVDGNTVVHYLGDAYNDAIYKDVLCPPEDTVAAGQTLDLALRNAAGLSPLHIAVNRLKLTLVEELLEAGAPVSIIDLRTGWTALHSAADLGDIELVLCLLRNGADIHARAFDGCTPLHLGVRVGIGAIVRELLDAGSDPYLSSAAWTVENQQFSGHESALLAPIDLVNIDDRLGRILKDEYRSARTIEHCNSVPFQSTVTEEGDFLAEAVGGSIESDYREHLQGSNTKQSIPFADDFSSLDFVIRLRLSKLLDPDARWKCLARVLDCEHMIEFIQICTQTDRSSPTVLLLDQYEQLPSARISFLIRALRDLGEKNAEKMLTKWKTTTIHNIKNATR